MPFKSKAQVGYMFANHPKIAKEFAAHTPSIKKLPQHVKTNRNSLKKSVSTLKVPHFPGTKSSNLLGKVSKF